MLTWNHVIAVMTAGRVFTEPALFSGKRSIRRATLIRAVGVNDPIKCFHFSPRRSYRFMITRTKTVKLYVSVTRVGLPAMRSYHMDVDTKEQGGDINDYYRKGY